MKEKLKHSFVEGDLEFGFNSKETMDEAYRELVNNTVRVEAEKDITILDTSNVISERNMEISDLLTGADKEAYDSEALKNPNFEATDYSYLLPFTPMQGSDNEVCDFVNQHTCLSAIIVDKPEEVMQKFSEVNYLTKEKAVEIIEEAGYSHLPLDRNAVQGFLSTKIGTGKSLSSILDIPDGKLKRELTDISVALSGANIEHNDGGFFKSTYGLGAAYLTNYKDFYGDEASNLLVEHFKNLGYDDITFDGGYLQKYYYVATFSSAKLGEEVLTQSKIDGTNAVARIVFKTSDYGLSSLNMTPYLEFEIKAGKFKTNRRIVINLSDMVYLNHNAATDEEEKVTMESLWKERCEELFAVVKDTADRLMNADKVKIRYPKNAMDNLLSNIGASSNFAGKDEIIDEFIEEFGMDCTFRDLYIYAFSVILEWEKTNQTTSLRAKEKLTRVLLSKSWSKFDTL